MFSDVERNDGFKGAQLKPSDDNNADSEDDFVKPVLKDKNYYKGIWS